MAFAIPQIEPISRFARDTRLMLQKISEGGPVYLTQRSQAVAVMLSMSEWKTLETRVNQLEWRERARQAAHSARGRNEPDLSFEQFMSELKDAHEQLPA